MAAAVLMKDNVPLSQKKNGVVTVSEKAVSPKSPISKKFDCEYPTAQSNVLRVQEPLPFPKKLKDLIA
jgi:hypothetical protein